MWNCTWYRSEKLEVKQHVSLINIRHSSTALSFLVSVQYYSSSNGCVCTTMFSHEMFCLFPVECGYYIAHIRLLFNSISIIIGHIMSLRTFGHNPKGKNLQNTKESELRQQLGVCLCVCWNWIKDKKPIRINDEEVKYICVIWCVNGKSRATKKSDYFGGI